MAIVEVYGDLGAIGFWEGASFMEMKKSFAAWAIPVLLELLVTVTVLYYWRLGVPGVAVSALVILTPIAYSIYSRRLSGRLWLPLAASLLGFVVDAGVAWFSITEWTVVFWPVYKQ